MHIHAALGFKVMSTQGLSKILSLVLIAAACTILLGTTLIEATPPAKGPSNSFGYAGLYHKAQASNTTYYPFSAAASQSADEIAHCTDCYECCCGDVSSSWCTQCNFCCSRYLYYCECVVPEPPVWDCALCRDRCDLRCELECPRDCLRDCPRDCARECPYDGRNSDRAYSNSTVVVTCGNLQCPSVQCSNDNNNQNNFSSQTATNASNDVAANHSNAVGTNFSSAVRTNQVADTQLTCITDCMLNQTACLNGCSTSCTSDCTTGPACEVCFSLCYAGCTYQGNQCMTTGCNIPTQDDLFLVRLTDSIKQALSKGRV